MLYKTHKAGGALAILVAMEVFRQKGLLLVDMPMPLQLLLMYPAASYGSTFPDLDHHINSVKEQTPANLVTHKILHLTKPKHRSWQTHSIFPTMFLCVALIVSTMILHEQQLISEMTYSILLLQSVGISVGVLSHLVLDTLTTAGIWITPGIKFRLVPKTPTFSTGTTWENIVRVTLYIAMAGVLAFWAYVYYIGG